LFGFERIAGLSASGPLAAEESPPFQGGALLCRIIAGDSNNCFDLRSESDFMELILALSKIGS
jgi:hypothetical protein